MHVLAAELAISERDLAVGQRKQSVILAQADVVARVPLGAALAHDDVSGANRLAAELLHAEALALTVAAVAGRAACLFMCHAWLLRFRSFLGRGLSRCSIFCRGGLGGFAADCALFGACRIVRSDLDVALARRVGLGLVLRSGIRRLDGPGLRLGRSLSTGSF